jgi:deferrochelatase/peroxidase EfeB
VSYDARPGAATLRWMQAGFLPNFPAEETPRNLLGFKDGTQNPGQPFSAEQSGGKTIGNGSLDEDVWVGEDGTAWMKDGSYLVVRRIRIALQHWDNTELDFQEQVIGRKKVTGAPLTGGDEFAPFDLDAVDADGNPVIDGNSHIRLGSATANDGARILRRSYSYNDGLTMIAERWPPWRQGLEYEAGLIFIAFQRDPRTGFIKIFDKMAKFDLLNQFTTHIGSAVFACPPGVAEGEFIGQGLFALQRPDPSPKPSTTTAL